MAGAGGAAAAAARRRMELEEEHMTQYSPSELTDDWEFKIVRTVLSPFNNPAKLQKLIDEEAQAGWVMLEKFDDTRVRFKRRRSARTNDASLPAGYDPYRTQYGVSEGVYVLIVIGAVILVMAIVVAIISFFEA